MRLERRRPAGTAERAQQPTQPRSGRAFRVVEQLERVARSSDHLRLDPGQAERKRVGQRRPAVAESGDLRARGVPLREPGGDGVAERRRDL
jgi:hypothetical protein